MTSHSALTCAHMADDGLLIRLIDNGLSVEEEVATLQHLGGCSDCLLLLAKVLEMQGQVVVDHYWTELRGMDPAFAS